MPRLVSHTLQRLAPGSPMPTKASQWNQLIDAAQFTRAQRVIQGSQALDRDPWATAIQVKNTVSGKRMERGDCLAVIGPINTVVTGSRFLDHPAVEGYVPNFEAHFGKLVVAWESIEPDGIGWCQASGVALVKLHMPEADRALKFADVNNIGPNQHAMQSHANGSWQILWTNLTTAPAGVEDGMAVVRWVGPQNAVIQGLASIMNTGAFTATGGTQVITFNSSAGPAVNATIDLANERITLGVAGYWRVKLEATVYLKVADITGMTTAANVVHGGTLGGVPTLGVRKVGDAFDLMSRPFNLLVVSDQGDPPVLEAARVPVSISYTDQFNANDEVEATVFRDGGISVDIFVEQPFLEVVREF